MLRNTNAYARATARRRVQFTMSAQSPTPTPTPTPTPMVTDTTSLASTEAPDPPEDMLPTEVITPVRDTDTDGDGRITQRIDDWVNDDCDGQLWRKG